MQSTESPLTPSLSPAGRGWVTGRLVTLGKGKEHDRVFPYFFDPLIA
jgi:hypothetical protein